MMTHQERFSFNRRQKTAPQTLDRTKLKDIVSKEEKMNKK